ncbi:hypothetical protein PRVXH_002275 [Proteinivorax hydrogeniformans]|uniref:Uncharacterized protein n=1 Tax=Proteinivorax hydrogeniformans TaxID=1826727 RepID=A0AAU8HSM3_9FIRM
MNTEELLIDDLREGMRQYLEMEYSHLKDKNVALSDAFYAYRHNVGVGFWESLKNEQAMECCREKLEEYFVNVRKVKTPRSNSYSYLRSMKILKEYIDKSYGGVQKFLENEMIEPLSTKDDEHTGEDEIETEKNQGVPTPSKREMIKYLDVWDNLENYTLQESALEKLFFRTYPKNTDIDDVLIKVSSLNDFYSTNIFSPYTVAKHIINLNIDERIESEDITLVNDLAKVHMDNGSVKNFYSFATKYCSHHNPLAFPIYDSYVDKVLRYFRDRDNFSKFKTLELKDYRVFKEILIRFRKFYELEEYSLKDIDKYLWLLGKEKFPNKY